MEPFKLDGDLRERLDLVVRRELAIHKVYQNAMESTQTALTELYKETQELWREIGEKNGIDMTKYNCSYNSHTCEVTPREKEQPQPMPEGEDNEQ